jgi:hypothetical protein
VRPDVRQAAEAYRLALPGQPLGGRLGERLGRGTGSSLEFMDFRDYIPGDDLRHIDWSAYARTDQMKVRLFREEIAPALDILVDVSPSMAVTEIKRQALIDLVEAAVLWTTRAGGRARRIRLDGDVFESWDEVEFEGTDAWRPLVPLRRRAMLLIVSDMLQPTDPGPRIRRLGGNAAHCYIVQLLDPWEAAPATEGPRTLIDCEVDEREDLVLDEAVVRRYQERLGRLCDAVRDAARLLAGTYALVQAGEPARMFREALLPQGVVEPA